MIDDWAVLLVIGIVLAIVGYYIRSRIARVATLGEIIYIVGIIFATVAVLLAVSVLH